MWSLVVLNVMFCVFIALFAWFGLVRVWRSVLTLGLMIGCDGCVGDWLLCVLWCCELVCALITVLDRCLWFVIVVCVMVSCFMLTFRLGVVWRLSLLLLIGCDLV